MIPIEVRSKSGCSDTDLRQFAERRMSFALDRFRNVRRIVVSMEDVNGPKGGPDKLCRIVAEFSFASIIVEEVQSNWQSSVVLAIRRLARKAARERERVNRSRFHVAQRTSAKVERTQNDAQETA